MYKMVINRSDTQYDYEPHGPGWSITSNTAAPCASKSKTLQPPMPATNQGWKLRKNFAFNHYIFRFSFGKVPKIFTCLLLLLLVPANVRDLVRFPCLSVRLLTFKQWALSDLHGRWGVWGGSPLQYCYGPGSGLEALLVWNATIIINLWIVDCSWHIRFVHVTPHENIHRLRFSMSKTAYKK